MAIAFDSVGIGTAAGGSILSTTHTINSNTNGILVALFGQNSNIHSLKSSPTFSGQSLTKILTRSSIGVGEQEIWYLLNPPTGLGTLNGTYNTATGDICVVTLAYTGVNQTTPINGSTSFAGASTSSGSLTDTTLATNALFVGGAYLLIPPGTTSTGNERGTINNTAELMGFDSTGGTLRWTLSSQKSLGIAAEIAPFVSGAGTNLIQSTGTAVLGLGSTSVTWGANTTTGNLIVVGVTLTNAAALGTVISVVDSQSNTYTRAIRGTISSVGDILNTEIWYATNITGGAGSVTVNHTVDNCAIFAREYSGFNTLDVTNAANGSSTAPNTGTVTTNFSNELLIVSTGDDKGSGQTWTAAGAYGDMVGTATTITGVSMEDNIVTSAGAQTGTLTLGAAANWESLMATFYNLVVSTGPAGLRTLLGVGN